MKTITPHKISPEVSSGIKIRLLVLFTISLIGFCLQNILQTDTAIQNNPINSPKITALANCAAPVTILASVRSKAHSGNTVKTPVGNNIQGLKKWSATASWDNNNKPKVGDDVLIPANSVIVIDQNINVKSIVVEGKLIIDLSKDITISAEYILTKGAGAYFEWGTEKTPYLKKGIITLKGTNKNTKIPGTSINSKAIVVANNSTLELHGNKKKSWTRLNKNAAANQNKITVAENTNGWAIGDEILIVSSRLNWNEAEKRTITAVSGDKKTFTLNSNLKFPHIGNKKTYTRSKDGKKWNAELRAEVGLLSKSIKIQGDGSSKNNDFGGHIMIHSGGKAHAENIELYQMGQKAIVGRYPFHWHLLQEKGAGQYLKNSSIHTSYNRAITIHGTESTLVENNFAYDHIGHGIFLEDGSERFNIIRGNVVAVSRRPKKGDEITPSDNQFNEVQNRTPSQFWITNPNNTFENNVAAGTEGTGFWFAMPQKPMQLSKDIPRFKNIKPHTEKLGKFSGNISHSCKSGFDIFDQLDANHKIIRNKGWMRTDKRYIDKHTFYANDLANYGGIGDGRKFTEGVIFRDNIYADNKTSLMFASYPTIENSVFIANSGENIFKGERKLNRGYDGALTLKNCHLIGWNADNANYVQNTGGAQKHVNYRISGITLDPETSVRMKFPNYAAIPKGEVGANAAAHPRLWSYVHWDMDGSISGKANTSIITNHPLCRDGSEVRYANWTNLYRTDRRFAYALIDAPGNPKMTIVRTKSGTPKAGQYYVNGFYGTFIHFPVMVNDGFLYTLQFESLGTGKFVNIHMKDSYIAGDEVLYRIKDFGGLPDLKLTKATKVNNLDAVKSAKKTSYAIVGKDLYLKMISTAASPDFASKISWSSNITLPKLDTDGDGTTDKQESINGTDPIGLGKIKTNPVITWKQNTTPTPITNKAPSISFKTPSGNKSVNEGYKLNIEVNASDTNGSINNVKLFINDVLIRQEKIAPYEWGHTGSPNPEELNGRKAGTYTIKAVATDNKGKTATKSITLTVKASTVSTPPPTTDNCKFGAPVNKGLTALNKVVYTNVHVLGKGGPKLNDFKKFNINWVPANNGLYQFAINTTSGFPDYYVDFKNSMSFQLKNAKPEVTLKDTGFTGLDGAYWIVHNSNGLFLVSKTKEYTIQFSNSSIPAKCTGKKIRFDTIANTAIIYPNPMTGKTINIRRNSAIDAEIKIYTISGAIVYRMKTNNQNVQINNLDLASGLYMITITSLNGTEVYNMISTNPVK